MTVRGEQCSADGNSGQGDRRTGRRHLPHGQVIYIARQCVGSYDVILYLFGPVQGVIIFGFKIFV